jgi:hypothetical protein
LKQWILRTQEQAGMRRESERRSLAAEHGCAFAGGADHGAMTAMDPVEIADGHDGPGKRTRIDASRAALHDFEAGDRLIHVIAGGRARGSPTDNSLEMHFGVMFWP